MAPAPRLTLRLGGTTRDIRRAIDACGAFMTEHAAGLRSPWQFQLALDEVLSNVVKHAYAGRTAGIIRVTFAVVDGEFRVSITDNGPAYDPLSAPPPDTRSPLDARRPGGLGVHLVRKLMDRVEYTRTPRRNCLTFGRRLL